MRKIFSALDIGSSYIKLVVGEFLNGKLNILCATKCPSYGFKNNQITDENKLIKCINKALNEASTKLNFKITKVIVNIPTDYNEFTVTESTIPVSGEDEIVKSTDILKVLQSTSYNQIKPNDELLATVPVIFKVGDTETNHPYGKKGKNISLKSVLITTDKKRVYDLVKLLEKCELEIIDIMPTGLVDYYNFKDKELDSKNTVVINIGSTTTNISVFTKGIYINNICLDTGGNDIDKEIAQTYNVRRKEAIYIKENLALANMSNAEVKENLIVPNIEGQNIKINQYELSSLTSKKLEELLKNIKKQINYLTKKEISYIIITGGLAEFKDIASLVNKIFANNSKLGMINEIGARDNSFSVSIGMLKFFNSKLELRGKKYSMVSESEIELMINNNSKITETGNAIIGKVFNYFFDN
jgi:cell division protein FtsA